MWAVGFTLIVLLALAVLSFGLYFIHAIAYGGDAVLSAEPTVGPPNPNTYEAAFIVSALVAIAISLLLVLLARSTPVAAWSPILQGLAAAIVAGVPAYVALTLMLGINPLDLLLA